METDGRSRSDGGVLEQCLARVCVAAAGTVQQSCKSRGHNAVERVVLTEQCGRGGPTLPSVQQSADTG